MCTVRLHLAGHTGAIRVSSHGPLVERERSLVVLLAKRKASLTQHCRNVVRVLWKGEGGRGTSLGETLITAVAASGNPTKSQPRQIASPNLPPVALMMLDGTTRQYYHPHFHFHSNSKLYSHSHLLQYKVELRLCLVPLVPLQQAEVCPPQKVL